MASTIAVIIPTYNRSRYLREAIKSVLAQVRQPDDFVVVDDGSGDDTPQVCAQYPQVRYIRQANGGLSAARNTGIAQTSSEFLVFLDDDDHLLPHTLRLQEAAFVSNPDAGLVYGRALIIDADGVVVGENLRNHRPPADPLPALLEENFVQIQTVMVKRLELTMTGPFRSLLAEDLDMWLRMAARGVKFAFINQPLAEYRKVPGTMSGGRLRFAESVLNMVQGNAELFPPTGRPLKYLAYCHYRVGRAALEEGNHGAARKHLQLATQGRPSNLRFWAYWLYAICPAAIDRPLRLVQAIKRRVDHVLIKLGLMERRWGTNPTA